MSIYRDGICSLFGTHDTSFYPDKFAAREITQLTVTCDNKENGCSWSDVLGNFEVLKKLLNNLLYTEVVVRICSS